MASIELEIRDASVYERNTNSEPDDRIFEPVAALPYIAPTLAVSALSEPISEQQRLIMEELIRAGASRSTLEQQAGFDQFTPVHTWPDADNVTPGLAPGIGGLLPGIAPLPDAATLPGLGQGINERGRSLAFDEDWEGGAFGLGRIWFTQPVNRQRSGVRYGTLPMVVFNDEPVSSFNLGNVGR